MHGVPTKRTKIQLTRDTDAIESTILDEKHSIEYDKGKRRGRLYESIYTKTNF